MAGAQVSVAGTGRRTVTAGDGSYALALPTDADSVRVRVERIGMTAQSRLVAPEGEASQVDFSMSSATVALDAIAVTGLGAPADAVAWREVDPAEAERRLGWRPVAVPQLPVLGVDVGRMEGRAVVRVRQRMADGSVLWLVQRRDPRARAEDGDVLRGAVEDGGGWQIVLEKEGLVVDASAPVRADSLRRIPPREAKP